GYEQLHNKEVAEANFALHESHCRRFLCLCPDCEEPVPKEQLDQHRLDQHTQVKCSRCNRKVERCHLMDHECEERLQCCKFCELEVPWKELDEHSAACGSRTERCGDCGRYVTLKDQLEHDKICPATQAVSGPPPSVRQTPGTCRGCGASFPAEEMEEHEEDEKEEEEGDFSKKEARSPLSSSLKAVFLSNRPSGELLGDSRDPNQISTCPHCHLALPLLTLRWHEVKCQIHIHLK
uniref:XIAP associated factor 1 n=1 Tax=Myripristis murdjan TaxID=586833 RepID=A0A667ZNW8_9TELE